MNVMVTSADVRRGAHVIPACGIHVNTTFITFYLKLCASRQKINYTDVSLP